MEVTFVIEPNVAGCNHIHVTANLENGAEKKFQLEAADANRNLTEDELNTFVARFLKHLMLQNNLTTKNQLRTYLVGKTFKF